MTCETQFNKLYIYHVYYIGENIPRQVYSATKWTGDSFVRAQRINMVSHRISCNAFPAVLAGDLLLLALTDVDRHFLSPYRISASYIITFYRQFSTYVGMLHVLLVFSFPFAASVGALNVQLGSDTVKHNIYIQCGAA